MLLRFDRDFLVSPLHRLQFSLDRIAVRRLLRPKDETEKKDRVALFSSLFSLRHSCGSIRQTAETISHTAPALSSPNRTATQRQQTHLQLPLHTGEHRSDTAAQCGRAVTQPQRPVDAPRRSSRRSAANRIDRARIDQLPSRAHERAQRRMVRGSTQRG